MLDYSVVKRVLAQALRTGGDFAELYVEDRTLLTLNLEDSKIENAVRGADRGAGVRVFFGSLVTYAYTDDLSEEALVSAARAAAAAGTGVNLGAQIVDLTRKESPLDFKIEKPFEWILSATSTWPTPGVLPSPTTGRWSGHLRW